MNWKDTATIGTALVLCLMMAMPSLAFTPMVTEHDVTGKEYYFVEFITMPDDAEMNRLRQMGLCLDEFYQGNTFLEHLDGDAVKKLNAERSIESVSPYTAEMKITPNLLDLAGELALKVVAHDGSLVSEVARALEGLGCRNVEIQPERTNSVECLADAGMLAEVAGIEQVLAVETASEPVTCMDLISSPGYMGIDVPQLVGFDGTGVLAEVQDDGIERTHPDLTRVVYTDGSVVVNAHGTCTSGIVFGTGSGDIKALGIAYGATGAFSAMGTGRGLSIQNLWNGDFNEGLAGMNGVLQSNSWMAAIIDGQYMSTTNEIDTAAHNYPHVLSFWAAGNANAGTDLGLLSEDGVAKNVICVGGLFHNNNDDPEDDKWMNKGVKNCASRGPAADGRQKPDLCGPYDLIYTIDQQGAAGYDASNYYFNFGGTSGATPTVSGCGVLVYDMYQANHFGNNPGGAWPYSSTVKAMMIADAHQHDLAKATRNEQGWGSADVENTYQLGAENHVIFEYPQALGSGQTWSGTVCSDGTLPLKISLAWNDPAAPATTRTARALINNLDLRVTSPTGTIYWGNNGLFDALWSTSGTGVNHWGADYRDDLNNLENVFVQHPEVGVWTVEVIGRTGDVAIGPQYFSLVASGARVSPGSDGSVVISQAASVPGDPLLVQIWDRDLNLDSGSVDSASVHISSLAEPTGEDIDLMEVSTDSGIFTGIASTALTDAVGTLQVSAADLVTAEYYDASRGVTVTDTSEIDGTAPGAPQPLAVDRWGDVSNREVAIAELYTLAWVFNDANHTHTQDDVRCFMMEVPSGSNGRLNVDVTYTIQLDSDSIAPYRLYLDAYTTGEAFTVSASVNGGTAVNLGQITATSDSDSYYQWAIAAAVPSSTVRIRMFGTTASNEAYDWLYLDHMYIMGTPALNPANQNTLNWTLSPDDGADVAGYKIYRSSGQAGPWDAATLIDSVPAGTDTYTDPGKGESDGIIWWYVVRARDYLGNEDQNTDAVPEIPQTLSAYDIDLTGRSAGDWAFVSFPVSVIGDIETILDDPATDWDVAKYWDAPSQTWRSHRKGSGMNTFDTINNQMGVWLHLTAVAEDKLTLNVLGSYPTGQVQITLYHGWNMVGYPSQTNQTANLALFGTGTSMISVYQAASPYLKDYSDLASVTMAQGNAYWVWVPSDTTWDVPFP